MKRKFNNNNDACQSQHFERV